MDSITRGQLGSILSDKMNTKTLHERRSEEGLEITDDWKVSFIETDETGTLVIYCYKNMER